MNELAIQKLLIGESAAMRQLRARIARVAPSRLPVLIQGPTGSGKELVARALHIASARTGQFVALNIAAIVDSLFESRIFGHMKGAFSGAVESLTGFLTDAHCGTGFMDEVGSLPLGLQCKLLRALDHGEFRPLGARADQRSDCRFVAATNESIQSLVGSARFRLDLAYRLTGVVIDVPPLSKRLDDVPLLVEHFAAHCTAIRGTSLRFSAAAMRVLQDEPWPGNVRELMHVVERTALFANDSMIDAETIRAMVRETRIVSADTCDNSDEREVLRRALEAAGWNRTRAARQLSLHPITVYRRMKRLGIVPPTDVDRNRQLP